MNRRLRALAVLAVAVVGTTATAHAAPARKKPARTTVRRTTTTVRRTATAPRPTTTTSTTAAPVVSDLVPGVGGGTPPANAQGMGPWTTRVRLARSSDGMTFVPDAGGIIDQAGVPTLMTDAAGRTRVYYIDWANGNVIAAAVENSPGVWAHRRVTIAGLPLGSDAVDPAVQLVGSTYRLWFMQAPRGGVGVLHSASSPDGFAFRYDGVAFQPAQAAADPTVVRFGDRYLLWAVPTASTSARPATG